jgi:23S rRNA (uracil1939-C5)-methyltransferase
VAYAAAVDIEAASSDRRDPAGDPRCGGCLYAHIAYPRQLELKSQVIADAFARIGRLELPGAVQVVPSPQEGYRMRARLHVRGRLAGFYREGTHEVCDARQTRQLLPATVDAVDGLVAALRSLGLDAVREIELAENLDASQRAMHLDGGAALDARSLERLAATNGLTGVSSPAGTHGDVRVRDAIVVDGHPPVLLERHVLAFFQGNRYLVNQLVNRVMSAVPIESDVLDLYAGVGLFAVPASAARAARVTAVEGDRIAASDLRANAAQTDGALRPIHQSVEEFLGDDSGPDRHHSGATIIVDPPRTGMSREALDATCRRRAGRLIYVSCDVATLARDARRIVDSGYHIAQADAFDLFPNTSHVETVVVFER